MEAFIRVATFRRIDAVPRHFLQRMTHARKLCRVAALSGHRRSPQDTPLLYQATWPRNR